MQKFKINRGALIKKGLKNYKELDIKELIKLYVKNDKNAVNEFWDRYAERIYNFPIKIYRSDEDVAGDFFTYVFERLLDGKKFSTFDINQNFDTWFYIVLRNFFFSMMRGKKEVDTVHVHYQDKEGKELFTIEQFEDRTQTTYYQSLEEKEYVDTIDALLQGLKTDYTIIIKLQLIYYFDLNKNEIKEISQNTGKKIVDILKKIDSMRKELEEKSRTISKKEAKIEKIYSIKRELALKLERLEREQKRGKDNELEIKEIKRKLEKRKSQFEKIVDEKERGMYIVKTPHKDIAGLLNITENAVSIRVHRAEKAMKDKLVEEGLV